MTLHTDTASEAPTPAQSAGSTEEDGRRKVLLWRIAMGASIVIPGVVMWLDVPSELAGGMALIMMLAFLVMKLPVGVAMAIPGVLGIWAILGWQPTEGVLQRMPFDATATWTLTVIPMFVLMGLLLFHSGITERLYLVARHWFGWLPGGLAVGTTVAGAGFAALSGSTLGSVFPLSKAGIPEMIKAGYDRRLAVGSVLAAGTLAHLIPPSLFLVLYAGVAETSVGQQLMAGLLPGVALAFMFLIAIVLLCTFLPRVVGSQESRGHASWSERWVSLSKVLPAIVLIIVVVGGLYLGFFTATEAGAVGALGALAITLWMRRRDRPWRTASQAVLSSVSTVGAVFLLVIGAHTLSRLVSVSGLAQAFVDLIIDIGLGKVGFLLVMMGVFVILGMFMDPIAMLLLTVPTLLPVLEVLDISLVWFGVFVVIFLELAVLTPPVGILSFVVHGIVQNPDVNAGTKISLGDVFVAAAFVVPVPLLLILVMIGFPELATWLPDSMRN